MAAEFPALRDIHLPDPLSLWPLAFGWYLLAGLLVLLLIPLLYFIHRYRQYTLPRRQALAELKKLSPDQLSELSMLLRRTAIVYYDASQVSSLTNETWGQFLKKTSKKPLFTEAQLRLLTRDCYRKETFRLSPELMANCQRWIKSCGEVPYV